jgi:hypothetical protein
MELMRIVILVLVVLVGLASLFGLLIKAVKTWPKREAKRGVVERRVILETLGYEFGKNPRDGYWFVVQPDGQLVWFQANTRWKTLEAAVYIAWNEHLRESGQ